MPRITSRVGLWAICAAAVSLLAGCKTYSLEELRAGAGCEPGRALDIAYLESVPLMVHGRSLDYARFRLTNVGSKSFGLYVEVDGERVEPYLHGISADLQRIDAAGAWVSDSVVLDHKPFPKQMLRLKPGESDVIVVQVDAPERGTDYRLMVQDEYDECWVRSETFRMQVAQTQRAD